jgi:hypothetical protein
VAAIAFALGGCAHDPPPAPKAPAEPAAAGDANRVKLAILPVESEAFPRLASFLNEVMGQVHVKGVDDYFVSKAPLEVVQLSIECVEATSACYANVGRSLTAQQLLLAHIAPGGTRRHDPSVRVKVTWFDVQTERARNAAEHVYKSEDEAMSAISDLVAQALTSSPEASASARAAQ